MTRPAGDEQTPEAAALAGLRDVVVSLLGGNEAPARTATFRQGVVDTVSPLTVRLGASSTAVPVKRFRDSYPSPVVGETVWLIGTGTFYVVLGVIV